MLAKEMAMFLMIPDASNQRILHPGKVVEIGPNTCVCEFEETIAPQAGDSVVILAERRQKFLQQGATVTLIRPADPHTLIALELIGEPASAESRGAYRVSLAASDMQIEVGTEKNCPLLDVSPEGFGAVAAKAYPIGSRVSVSLVHENKEITTLVRVQTVKARPDKRFRYGFLVEQQRSPMRHALQRLHAAMQQQQLRRLAGTA